MTYSTYYAVLVSDGVARVFTTKKEALDYCKDQSEKYSISGLLLTCKVGIR